jgi:hypothetical protein
MSRIERRIVISSLLNDKIIEYTKTTKSTYNEVIENLVKVGFDVMVNQAIFNIDETRKSLLDIMNEEDEE